MFTWLRSILQGYAPAFMIPEHDKARLRKLVAFYGITEAQQEELNRLVVTPLNENNDRMKTLSEIYISFGAIPRYSSEGHANFWPEMDNTAAPITAHLPFPMSTEDLQVMWLSRRYEIRQKMQRLEDLGML